MIRQSEVHSETIECNSHAKPSALARVWPVLLLVWLGFGEVPARSSAPPDSPVELDPWYRSARPADAVQPGEQAAFIETLNRFAARRQRDDFGAVEEFLSRYPSGAWAPALRLRLAEEFYSTGWYSKAVQSLENLWGGRGLYPGPDAAVAFTRAGVQMAELYARLGRREDVERVLAVLETATLAPGDEEILRGVRQGLATMKARPEAAFRCGALALERIRVFLNTTNAGHASVLESKSSRNGMSLAEVAGISKDLGMNYRMVFRPPGAAMVTPAVMHLRIGHFVAVVRERRGQVQIEDPTGWETTFASLAAVNAEASGYFLIPPGQLPRGWREVDVAEGARVVGRNGVLDNDPDGASKRDRKAKCPGGSSFGMATWDVHLMLVSQQIVDTPIGYEPPFGPPVYVTLRHTQRSNRRFGYKPTWTHSWSGQIYENPRTPLGDLWLQDEGGWERFSPLDDEGQSYQGRIFNEGRFARPDEATIEWKFPDGTRRRYTTFSGTNVLWGRVFYLTGVEDASGNRATIQVLPGGRVESVTDPLGRATRFFYELPNPGIPPSHDAPGTPAPLSGVAANYEYTNQVTRIVDPFGRAATLQYAKVERWITGYCGDGTCPFYYYNYDLTNIVDVAGMSSQFVYDWSGSWVTNLVTPYGATRFNWMSKGAGDYAIEITDPEGDTERIEFVPYGVGALQGALWQRPQGMRTDGNAYAVAHWGKKAFAESYRDGSWDGATLYLFQSSETLASAGRVLMGVKPPLENMMWFNYPGQGAASLPGVGDKPSRAGRVLDDGSTQLWQTERDAWGNVVRSVDPMGRTYQYIYSSDSMDLLEVRQTRNGQNELLLKAAYNSSHQPLAVTDAAGQTTRYTYNSRGQTATITNPLNETTTFIYDANGFLTAIDGPLSGGQDKTAFAYDAAGRVLTATDGEGYKVVFDYDALDRITRITLPDGTFQTLVYDRMELGSVRDRFGRETRFEHDGLRRVTAIKDALGRVTRFQWCGCGSLDSVIDPLGRMTRWNRDLQGRVISKEYADGSKTSLEYEKASSRLLRRRDEQNQITEFRYNLSDAKISRRYFNAVKPTPDVAYAYDPDYLRVSSMTDGNGTTLFRYNPLNGRPGAGRLTSVDGPWANDEIASTYDELGRVTRRALNGVAAWRTYDPAGRVSRMTNILGGFDYAYEGASERLSAVSYPNGQRTEYAYYDNAGDRLLQRITHWQPGGAKLSEFAYSYNALGQITSWNQQQAGRLKTWMPSYDIAARLTNIVETVSSGVASAMGWNYDGSDNRTLEQSQGGRRQFSYNALNQLAGIDAIAATQPSSYEWDAENRLVAVVSGAQRVEFEYDGLDRRTRIVVRDGSAVISDRRYVWSGAQLLEERDSSGATVLKRYSSHGLQNLGASELPAGNYFYTRDHLGSIREMTSASGIPSVYDYSAFGERTTLGSGLPSDLGYTGHFQMAAIDLVLAPFRAYRPALGRWLSRDPGGEGHGHNLYAYTADPINHLDPYGYDESRAAGLANQTQGYKDAKAGMDTYNKAEAVAKLTDKLVDKGIKDGLHDEFEDAAKKPAPEGARKEYEKMIEEDEKNAKAVDEESNMLRDLWNMAIDALGGGDCPKKKPKTRPKPKQQVEEKGLWDTFWDSVTGSDSSKPAQPDGPIKKLTNPMKQFETPLSELY